MPGFFSRLYREDQPKVRHWIISWVIVRSAQLMGEIDQREMAHLWLAAGGNTTFLVIGYVITAHFQLSPLGYIFWLAAALLGHIGSQQLIGQRAQQERRRLQATWAGMIDEAIDTFPRLTQTEILSFMRLVEKREELALQDLLTELDRLPNLAQWPFWNDVVRPVLMARRTHQRSLERI